MKKIKSLSLSCVVAAATCFLNPVHSIAMEVDDDLGLIDAFHPPVGGTEESLLYKELHIFTVHSQYQNILFSTVQTLEGDITDPMKSYAIDVQNFTTPTKSDLTANPFPITAAQWSATSPDVTIGNSSVSFDDGVYHVHTVSPDALTVLDAEFKPTSTYEPALEMDGLPSGLGINWLVTSPRMLVNGTITTNKGTESETTYQLKNASGYHDHIWGEWDWSNDIGWSYGHAVQDPCRYSKKFWSCKRRNKKHTLSVLNVTDSHDTESFSTVLNLWKDDIKLGTFSGEDLDITSEMMDVEGMPGISVPESKTFVAKSGEDFLKVTFTTEDYAPIYLPIEGGYRLLWQLSGSYKARGRIDGRRVRFQTDGNMEYLATPFITE